MLEFRLQKTSDNFINYIGICIPWPWIVTIFIHFTLQILTSTFKSIQTLISYMIRAQVPWLNSNLLNSLTK